jgi:nucleotide-binding universal stress UspA family protein
MKLFEKILLPTDFSDHAHEALHFAAQLAQTHAASLCLVHVYDILPYALPEGMPMIDEAQMSQLRDAFQKQLQQLRGRALESGIANVETLLLPGNPASEIVRVASEQHFDLIVMGTHGRTGLSHLLLGSVTEKVVRKAPCAVLTVPLHKKEKA